MTPLQKERGPEALCAGGAQGMLKASASATRIVGLGLCGGMGSGKRYRERFASCVLKGSSLMSTAPSPQ